MSASPLSSSTPTEKRFRYLKHSKTFTSLSESIRGRRDPDSAATPTSPRSQDAVKSPVSPDGQITMPESDRNPPSPSPFSSQSIYGPSRSSLTIARKYGDTPRSPTQRPQGLPILAASPRSADVPTSPLRDVSLNEQPAPSFLQKRAISSPVPQSIRAPQEYPQQIHPAFAQKALLIDIPGPTSLLPQTQNPSTPTTPLHGGTPHQVSDQADYQASPEAVTAQLVAASGATQTAIIQLVKDKQAALNRSEQLARLVEQQKETIDRLTRNLELALQERDQYRKTLKEHLATTVVARVTLDMGAENRPTLNNIQEEPGPPVHEIGDTVKKSESTRSHMRQDQLPLTPVSPETPLRTTPHSPPSQSGPVKVEVEHTPNWQSPSNGSPIASSSRSSRANALHSAPLHDPTSSPVEKSRKAPPKALNLSQMQRVNPPTYSDENADDSGSEYGDVDIKEALSIPERGRRKTRSDDDRDREALAMEQERLQHFEKLKQSKPQMQPLQKSVPTAVVVTRMPSYRGVDTPSATGGGMGLPSSPRAPLDAALQSPQLASFGSISTTMTATRMVPAQTREQTLQAPLMSPGLPLSPRPGDRPINAPQPRMPIKIMKSLASFPGQQTSVGLPSSPRVAPPAILVPQQPPQPLLSPTSTGEDKLHVQTSKKGSTETPTTHSASPIKADTRDPNSALMTKQPQVFRGFTSEHYPSLLLPPNALLTIDVRVDSCRLMPVRGARSGMRDGEEDAPFTLTICSRSDGKHLWRVQKTLPALTMVDQALRHSLNLDVKVPEKSLFSGQAPAKIDVRREALYDYFQGLLNTSPLDERTAVLICAFFSTDVLPPRELASSEVDSGVAASFTRRKKEGYLSKKGKSLGVWKARYFVLDSTNLRYFEFSGGAESGNINLANAQIARQTISVYTESLEYRHAFMIMEENGNDSKEADRHILCAETDEERDAWIDALLPYTEPIPEVEKMSLDPVAASSQPTIIKPVTNKPLDEVKNGKVVSKQTQDPRRPPLLQIVSYDSTVAVESPLVGATSARASWSPTSADNISDTGSQGSSHVSTGPYQPVIGAPPPLVSATKKSPMMAKKKRSIFGFRNKASDDNVPTSAQSTGLSNNGDQASKQRELPGRSVFGIPLAEAAEFFPPRNINTSLPAPVYRCIEYLENKQAVHEEGIFRLSGSSTAVKALKDQFDEQGDVNLLDGQYHDIHAVASLLKMFFRELPEPVLTRQLQNDFLLVIDSNDDDKKKLADINLLVRKLPYANTELLATLSRYLIDIVNNSDRNKMSIRNVGIVFSQTLNLPTELISLFLTDYVTIFDAANDNQSSLTALKLTPTTSLPSPLSPTSPDALRSPYRQFFNDAATPRSSFNDASNGTLGFPRRVDSKAGTQKVNPKQWGHRASYDHTRFTTLTGKNAIPLPS